MVSIENTIKSRTITEILHFTTNHGLVGMASIGEVISRDQLEEDSGSPLFALNPKNAKFRSDPEWISYINLSISRINSSFFGYSRSWKRAPNDYWVILSFKPEILTHEGVVFSTTNNIYHGSCVRKTGNEGLQNCFSDKVVGKSFKPLKRQSGHPSHWTTCQEAEVLYPSRLSLDFLQKIYVEDEESYDQVVTTVQLLMGNTDINVEINPQKFKGY